MNRPRLFRRVLPAVVLVFTAGCAVTPPRTPPTDLDQAWSRHMQEVGGIDSWEVKGKLAVRSNKRGEQMNMRWHRNRDQHDINLYGPMGIGNVILTSDPDGAMLRDNKKRTYTDETPEALLYRVAGWLVPFTEMQYWMLGVPSPTADYEKTLDSWGRLATLEQNGWRIEFLEYRSIEGKELPRRFDIEALPGSQHIVVDKDGENDHIRVKAIIKRFSAI